MLDSWYVRGAGGQAQREPKVGNLRDPPEGQGRGLQLHQDVARVDVPVDDPRAVDVLQARGQVAQQLQDAEDVGHLGLLVVEQPLAEHLGQVAIAQLLQG